MQAALHAHAHIYNFSSIEMQRIVFVRRQQRVHFHVQFNVHLCHFSYRYFRFWISFSHQYAAPVDRSSVADMHGIKKKAHFKTQNHRGRRFQRLSGIEILRADRLTIDKTKCVHQFRHLIPALSLSFSTTVRLCLSELSIFSSSSKVTV